MNLRFNSANARITRKLKKKLVEGRLVVKIIVYFVTLAARWLIDLIFLHGL